jgi:hypothetical protein
MRVSSSATDLHTVSSLHRAVRSVNKHRPEGLKPDTLHLGPLTAVLERYTCLFG